MLLQVDSVGFREVIKEHNGSVRSSFRRILLQFSDELVKQLKIEFMKHDTVTGTNTIDSFVNEQANYAWERNISMSATAFAVEKGVDAHTAPIDNLRQYAKNKQIDVGALWYTIKTEGQQAHPFMQRAYNNIDLESIIIRNVNR